MDKMCDSIMNGIVNSIVISIVICIVANVENNNVYSKMNNNNMTHIYKKDDKTKIL